MGKFLVFILGIATLVCSFAIEVKVVQVIMAFIVIMYGQKIRKKEGDSLLISIGQLLAIISIIEYIISVVF